MNAEASRRFLVTPLNDVQQRILALREFPMAIFSKIATQFSNTDVHSHEM
jgi:hypothetical protein